MIMSRLITSLISLLALVSGSNLNAQTKPKWVVPSSAVKIENPVGSGSATLASAKILYINNCAPCHGEKGKGNSPASASLVPKPADHSSSVFQSQSDGAIFYKLSEGRSPMPAYKAILSDQQRWGLVSYIRTLKKK